MTILDIPRSGRDGDFVYYMRGKKLCRRRYFIPTNVRTPGRRLARGAFGAVAKAWSRVLTEPQRQAWNAAAAKVRSRPRLWQSGWLTGQAFFQGICSARARIGREMLLWPPEPVAFGPNQVTGLSIGEEQGRLRLRVRVAGPLVGDIMVFGAAPCSPGRKKWRHGAYLGLLPAPVDGESDITELYVARYGEPRPGERVFIRTRRQQDGWEDQHQVVTAVVGVAELQGLQRAAEVEIRSPKADIRRNPENRISKATWSGGPLHSPGQWVPKRCTREQYRGCSIPAPGQCRTGAGRKRRVRSAKCEMRSGGEALFLVLRGGLSGSRAPPRRCPGSRLSPAAACPPRIGSRNIRASLRRLGYG
jgi:hypothetical protein